VLREQRTHRVELHRLFERARHMHTVSRRHALDRCNQAGMQRADENHRNRRAGYADVSQQLHAITVRHVDVGHDDIERSRQIAEDIERLPPAGDIDDTVCADFRQQKT
jgi:hypothetical protein